MLGIGLLGDGSETEFLGQLLEAIPAPVFYKDADQAYRGCNTAFERFMGMPRERIIGRTVFDIAPPDLAQLYFDQDQALLDNPPLQVYEAEVDTSEGKRSVVFHKATYVDAGGHVAGIVGVILDITERRQAEDALRSAYRAVSETSERCGLAAKAFEVASEGMVIAQRASDDEEYLIVDVNDAYCRLTGRSREAVLNASLAELQAGTVGEFASSVEESLRATGVWKGEVRIRRTDGTGLPAWLSLAVIPDEDRPGTSVVGVFTGLAEIKQALDRLK
jgi:PAS domain S-box-containing protein